MNLPFTSFVKPLRVVISQMSHLTSILSSFILQHVSVVLCGRGGSSLER